ncbi:hypothetical protein [Winogradskyella sediminis]|uniref:hypothetical protein n=1 Tax=Winogradskyella sediminis TaxID=1382466 RepID=UPI000E27EA9C|nr:hypothetical protein [Winogradskyella sediminis]REG87732.1 hypothetical protein C8N41_102577 [Winogradskyella sediminis]
MKKFIKKTSVLLVLLLVVTQLVSFFSLYILRQSTFYKPNFLVNGLKRDNYDYVILGASTGLTTLDSKLIDSITNLQGVNLSMDDTNLASHYLMLKHFIAEGKTLKYCIIAPSNMSYNVSQTPLSNNDYRFLMYINRDYVLDHYSHFKSDTAKRLYYSKWFPFLGLSYYNTELFYPSLISAIKPHKRNRFDDLGNYSYPTHKNRMTKVKKKEAIVVSFESDYLKKIKLLCDAYQIKLICYLSPTESQPIDVYSKDYLFINHSNLIKNSDLFYDDIHVNGKGRQVASEAFSKVFMDIVE